MKTSAKVPGIIVAVFYGMIGYFILMVALRAYETRGSDTVFLFVSSAAAVLGFSAGCIEGIMQKNNASAAEPC
jgi:hypothetical protein